MNICIVGWYYNKGLYELLAEYGNITCIMHREPEKRIDGVRYISRENVGLEFGAYDYFIKNIWSAGDTLFMHDDLEITDIEVLTKISKIKDDHAWIWKSTEERVFNHGAHGRGVFMSHDCIQRVLNHVCNCEYCIKCFGKPHNGIFYDAGNHGFTGGKTVRGDAMRLDAGIQHLKWYLKNFNGKHFIDDRFSAARRGSFENYV